MDNNVCVVMAKSYQSTVLTILFPIKRVAFLVVMETAMSRQHYIGIQQLQEMKPRIYLTHKMRKTLTLIAFDLHYYCVFLQT